MPAVPDRDPQLYARSFADVYDAWYGDLEDPRLLVEAFAKRLAPGATILELGSGTGRLATPLTEAGFNVLALDASLSMLRQDKLNANRLCADMAAPPVRSASIAAVLIAYNTFFNLDDRQTQQDCLVALSLALAPGGLLAIDVFSAPEDRAGQFGITIRDHPAEPNARLAILTGPDRSDPAIVVGSHVELADEVTCRPWRIAYCSPADLDSLAVAAGLTLVGRYAHWNDANFSDQAIRHVSWYRR